MRVDNRVAGVDEIGGGVHEVGKKDCFPRGSSYCRLRYSMRIGESSLLYTAWKSTG